MMKAPPGSYSIRLLRQAGIAQSVGQPLAILGTAQVDALAKIGDACPSTRWHAR
jgi:hypothetical protein